MNCDIHNIFGNKTYENNTKNRRRKWKYIICCWAAPHRPARPVLAQLQAFRKR